VIRESFVVFILVEADSFGVFLHEAEQDASGPLFGVEVVEFFRLTRLDVLGVGIVGGIFGADDQMQEGHPSTGELFDLVVDFVVYGLPEELDAEIDVFGVLARGEQFLEGGKCCLEELARTINTAKK
jgi:hypothetical protein